jgi:DNA-directed RNA polymerase specialized sigma24 family protein
MIDYINTKLNLWAAWAATGRTRLGYPREAAFMSAMRGGRPAEINDGDAMTIEHAVRILAPEQRQVVTLYYLRMRSCAADQIARECGCSRDTVYHRLHRAHLAIKEALEDRELSRQSGWQAQIEPGKWRSKIA